MKKQLLILSSLLLCSLLTLQAISTDELSAALGDPKTIAKKFCEKYQAVNGERYTEALMQSCLKELLNNHETVLQLTTQISEGKASVNERAERLRAAFSIIVSLSVEPKARDLLSQLEFEDTQWLYTQGLLEDEGQDFELARDRLLWFRKRGQL